MSESKANNINIGKLGEDLACKYLKDRDFKIIERNYRKRYGEIDIIAEDSVGTVRFVEVKTVSHETRDVLNREVIRETWRPEERVDDRKLHQIHKAVQTWLAIHNYQGDFQIDILALRAVPREKYVTVNHIETVILE